MSMLLRTTGPLLLGCLSMVACSSTEGAKDGAKAGGDGAAAAAASTSGGTITGSGKGFKVTMTGSMEAPGRAGATGPQANTTTVRVLDGKARIDVVRGGAANVAEGGWMLVDADAGSMSIVDPAKKRVMVMDSLASLAGGMADMGMMQMTVTDTSSRVEDLGAGEQVLGLATHKYRVRIGYTMNMTVMGKTMPMRTEQESVVQMSEDATLQATGFEAFEKAFRSSMGGLGGAEAAKVIAALNANRPKGFPMSQDMQLRNIRNGDTTTVHNTMRVTELVRGGVSESDFVVPAGYQRNDVGASMRDMKARSAAAMQQAGEAGERVRKAMEAAEAGAAKKP